MELAQVFHGQIINADSRQVYRYMDIGTAKPSPEEQRLVPHHLIDLIDPDQRFHLASFLALANQAITDIASQGQLPIVVGGTGQYVWALVEGWQVPKVAPDSVLRAELEGEAQSMGTDVLHQRLKQIDPIAAARIHPNNLRRLVRALEVRQSVASASWQEKDPPDFDSLVIGLTMDRDQLYHRIDLRVDRMMEAGLLQEVNKLLEMGYAPELPAMGSTGYRELAQHLRGDISLEEAVQRIKYATHRLARRQYAWFRLADPHIHWLDASEGLLEQSESLVGRFLASKLPCDTMAPERAEGN